MKNRAPQLEVARIQNEINRLFNSLMRLREDGDEAHAVWHPHADVLESLNSLAVEVGLPGVSAENVTVTIADNQLVVRGERPQPPEGAGTERIHDEREFGRFERSIPLVVPVNPREATATLSHGVLRIELPRVPNRRGSAVEIQVNTLAESTAGKV